MNIPKSLKLTKEFTNSAVLDIVYQRAKSLLEINLFPHYTKHDITHSARVLEQISKLIECAKIKLLNEEKFILICAVLLHDIGMCTTKYISNKNVDELTNDDKDEIRKQHHIFSSKLIKESVDLNQGDKYYLGLSTMREFVESIALVAKFHRDDPLSEIEKDIINGITIRQDLLCALMRLGDLLDMDQQRVDIERLNTITISDTSKVHWYSHFYLSGIDIENLKITLYFKFPKEYEGDNNKVVVDFIQERLTAKITEQIISDKTVWKNYNIVFHEKIDVNKKYSDTVLFKIHESVVDKLLEELRLKEVTYRGLGEIDFYWGGSRENANIKIQEYLEITKSNEIFIAAIGFGTIEAVIKKPKVLINLKNNMICNSDFKIIFVLPGSEDSLIKIRPDGGSPEKLIENFKKGRALLFEFIEKLENECFPDLDKKQILSHIEFKNYDDDKIIPRHFILYGDEGNDSVIFVGSYLGHTVGKKSYIMKLKKNYEQTVGNFTPGLFDLFEKEINHIRNHCTNDITLFDKMPVRGVY